MSNSTRPKPNLSLSGMSAFHTSGKRTTWTRLSHSPHSQPSQSYSLYQGNISCRCLCLLSRLLAIVLGLAANASRLSPRSHPQPFQLVLLHSNSTRSSSWHHIINFKMKSDTLYPDVKLLSDFLLLLGDFLYSLPWFQILGNRWVWSLPASPFHLCHWIRSTLDGCQGENVASWLLHFHDCPVPFRITATKLRSLHLTVNTPSMALRPPVRDLPPLLSANMFSRQPILPYIAPIICDGQFNFLFPSWL